MSNASDFGDFDAAIKRDYAMHLLLRPNDTPTYVALCITDNYELADKMAKWEERRELEPYKRELIAEYGEAHFLPTMGDMTRAVLNRIYSHSRDMSHSDYVGLMRFAVELREAAIGGDKDKIREIGPQRVEKGMDPAKALEVYNDYMA